MSSKRRYSDEERKQRHKISSKAHREKYKDKVRATSREFMRKIRSVPERRKQLNERCKEGHRLVRQIVIMAYGGKCACCGEDRYEFLAIDHKNGGGNAHRRSTGNHIMTNWLFKNGFPDGFQVLCHNCNMAKAFYGKCPHERDQQ